MTNSGKNRSSLLSIINDLITLNFFKRNIDIIGKTKVVTKTMAKHKPTLINNILYKSDAIITKNIHVGNKTG